MKLILKHKRLTKIFGLFFVMIIFSINTILAQNTKTVSGVIKDAQGSTMPGVSVTVKGTTIGILSDVDGKYSINVPVSNNTLIFNFLGMRSEEIDINGRTVINVNLEEDAIQLQEVVAIGYGVKTRATTTGAVDVVGKKQFENRPMTNTTDFLQGVVPGMEIRRRDAGKVGEEGFDILIRGITSRSDPGILVVVDGIPYKDTNAGALNKLNPQDIESMTVLKDAQASIYGARAAGGVILVTTKKGTSDKPTISYSCDFSFNRPARTPKKVNVLQHIDMMNQAYTNDGIKTHLYSHLVQYINTADINASNPLVVKGVFGDTPDLVLGNHDWWSEMYGTAFDHSHNLTVSGRTEKSNYFTSIGYLDQSSMFRYGDHSNKKYSARFKYDYQINKYIKIRSNAYVGKKKVVEPYDINHLAWLTYWTWNCQPIYNPQGEYYAAGGFGNPVAYAKHIGKTNKTYYSYYTQLGFDITPIDNLTITGDFSKNFDIRDENYSRKRHQTYHWDGSLNYDVIDYWFSGKTKAGSQYDRNEHTVASLYANYNFNLDKHKFNLMIGGSHEELDNRGFGAHRYDLITDELDVMGIGSKNEQYNSEYLNDWALSSFFGRLSYDFKDRYFVEATYRNDGSSKFEKGNKWQDFWGLSGSWILSNEKLFEGAKRYVDHLKLRLSWGQLGNQNGIGLYDFYQYIDIMDGAYPMGGSNSPSKEMGTKLGKMPSLDHSWETIDSYNGGIDFTALNNRLGGTFDYYIKNNKGMFYHEEFPTVLGTTPPTINGAYVRTKGWEISLNWKDRIGNLGYRLGASLSNYTSEVMDLKDARNPGYGHNAFIEGHPVNSFFLYEFDGFIDSDADLQEYLKINGVPRNLRVGDAKFIDKDGDGTLEPHLYKEGDPNSGDIVYKGHGNQQYLYGINLELEWKGIDFRAFFQGVGKWMVMNHTYAAGPEVWKQSSEYFYNNTWTQDNKGALYPRLTQDGGIHWYNYQQSSAPYKFINNRYLRLKDIQLGYTIPQNITRKFGVDKLRAYVNGSNLLEFDNLPKGFDPEVPFAESLIPFTRTFSLGLNIVF